MIQLEFHFDNENMSMRIDVIDTAGPPLGTAVVTLADMERESESPGPWILPLVDVDQDDDDPAGTAS